MVKLLIINHLSYLFYNQAIVLIGLGATGLN